MKPISEVRFCHAKPALYVEGRPFFYNGIQFSLVRLMERDGWSWEDMEQLFRAAKESGYTVVGVPLLWRRTEPARNTFHREDIERSLTYAQAYDLHIEFLWFGSQICSFSSVSEGTPGYLFEECDLVCFEDGSPYTKTAVDAITGKPVVYQKLDPADNTLLALEANALKKVLAHAAAYTKKQGWPARLVGIEVLNEPTAVAMWDADTAPERSFSPSARRLWAGGGFPDSAAFNAFVLYQYCTGLAAAVKQSRYPVWTRLNLYDVLEGKAQLEKLMALHRKENERGKAALDCIGGDIYTRKPKEVAGYCTNSPYAHRRNLMMVMENGAHYENGAELLLTCLANDGLYHVWELCDTVPDWPAGLYFCDKEARKIWPKKHQPGISAVNAWLQNNAANLAARSALKGEIQHLSVEGCVQIQNGGIAFGLQGSGTYVLCQKLAGGVLIMNLAPVVVKADEKPLHVSFGKFDRENHWRESNGWKVCRQGDAITIPGYSCSLILDGRT